MAEDRRTEFHSYQLDDLADAVIRELKLETQAHYDPDCEFYRYVTDWIDPQTNQRVDLPMTNDIRTRIAAVLRTELLQVGYSRAEESADGDQWVFIDGTVMPDALADAVLTELRLTREQLDADVNIPEVGTISRYTTEWTADE